MQASAYFLFFWVWNSVQFFVSKQFHVYLLSLGLFWICFKW
jgi:hypothetical protein